MERFLVIYSLLRKIQLFPVSTLENVRRYQLESLPRGRRNCAREYISSMKIGKRRKDCMRFENSGRFQQFLFPLFAKQNVRIFIHNNSFYNWEEYSQEYAQKLIYFRKLFILHSQQFFIYIYFFFFLFFFPRGEFLIKIANVLFTILFTLGRIFPGMLRN